MAQRSRIYIRRKGLCWDQCSPRAGKLSLGGWCFIFDDISTTLELLINTRELTLNDCKCHNGETLMQRCLFLEILQCFSQCWILSECNIGKGSYARDSNKQRVKMVYSESIIPRLSYQPTYYYISPHSNDSTVSKPTHSKLVRKAEERGEWRIKMHVPTIFTANFGLLFGPVGTFSIFRSVSMPSTTFPNTTCFPSKKSHFAVVMKN